MNATTLPAEILAFAAAVRAALSDLPADEVEELTEGLEADLAEAYAEDLARELPDPADYAAELRGAAGLPTPEDPVRGGRMREITTGFVGIGRDLERNLRRSPAMASTLDFLATLRPAWWIVRGWLAYQVICHVVFGVWKTDVLPEDLARWVLLVVLVAGSVTLGLRSWPRWVLVPVVLGNTFAALVLLPILANVTTGAELQQAYDNPPAYEYDVYDDAGYGGDGGGLWSNGLEVTNIFAYDAKGKAISGVQLFDQDGKPLTTALPGGNGCLVPFDEETGCPTLGAWVPVQLETGAQAWNVFPMRMAESDWDDPGTPIPGAVPQDRPAPFLKVPALLAPETPDEGTASDAKSKKSESNKKSS